MHVRLEDNETGCAATTTLELIVNPIPEIITPPILEVCDANYDGITTIDLSSLDDTCLLYTSPSPRDVEESRMPSSA